MTSSISSEDKVNVLQAHLGSILDAISGLAQDRVLASEDIIEVFAMGIAVIIEHDSWVNTPRRMRIATKITAKTIEQRIKDFRRLSAMSDKSALDILLSGTQLSAYSVPG